MNNITENYDVVVIGAGHAGVEAALVSARMGLKTILFTISIESIALMPCNPNIGGTSKGHLVRELDALGGEMAVNIDKTFIQSKMLNLSKGPAVHSLRVQADKMSYSVNMRKTLENTENLDLKQTEVSELLIKKENGKNFCYGVKTIGGTIYLAKSVVITTGTYLDSRCIYGEVSEDTGPNGLKNSKHLSSSLKKHGIKLYRFKTGTPARIDKRSIDFSVMEEQKGDDPITPFSFTTKREDIQKEQISCYLTYTNEKTHRIIKDNIHRSPLFSGFIEGTGPRYCPSIEDKVVKFPDKDRHQIFIEPEGLNTNEMYLAGLSSSLPEDVQFNFIKTIKGLENAKIVRYAYAIEYDCIDARQLNHSLEFKNIKSLFSAGQFNGSSGYEEAAVQGFIAGVNAAKNVLNEKFLTLDRSEGYIGVLIDDLVTKESLEPYRMMTSRSEYRLLLRQDNADLRLFKKAYEFGTIDKKRYENLLKKESIIEEEISRLNSLFVPASKEVQEFLEENNSTTLKTSATMAELIRRPELTYDLCSKIDKERPFLPFDIREQININIKYEGYIKRQSIQVKHFKKMENKKIPNNIKYENVNSLRIEAIQKLNTVRPESIGQASRISGVSPADISVLLVYLESFKAKTGNVDSFHLDSNEVSTTFSLKKTKEGLLESSKILFETVGNSLEDNKDLYEYDLETKDDSHGFCFEFNKALHEFGLELTPNQILKFYEFYKLLIEENKKMNLTNITEQKDVIYKHFIDSLMLVKFIPEIKSKPYKIIDIGTGAGFPGIPLAIAFENLNFLLLDTLNKRVLFLKKVAQLLDLKNVSFIHARAEDLGRNSSYRERFDLAVSRAVASLPVLLEISTPFVKPSSFFIAYKSEKSEEELEKAKNAIEKLNVELDDIYDFNLVLSNRKFLKFKKTGNTPKKLPRRSGVPKKEPL